VKNLVFFCLLSLQCVWGQSDTKGEFTLQGYLKYFGAYSAANPAFLDPSASGLLALQSFDQQLHNRFDFRYYKGNWLAGLSMRNRLFNGSSPQQGASFFERLDDDPGLVDLSFLYWRDENLLLHTILDRVWGQYSNEKWLIRLGRQRINWGINSVFNPNDILNQYNFFDFDYEERPGTDALRIQFFPNYASSLELAIAPKNELNESTAALLYRNNSGVYDLQVLAGVYAQSFTVGGGWAGSIGSVGFKGEGNYYTPLIDREQESWVLSLALDYVFGSGIYLSTSYLYNQSALANGGIGDFGLLGAGQVLSPKNPFIFRHTLAINVNYNFNPLLNASLTAMYSPDANSTILFPSLSYSLRDNLDVLIAGQFFLADNALQNEEYQWLVSASYLRLKWSF
jgi:hypothetical protein